MRVGIFIISFSLFFSSSKAGSNPSRFLSSSDSTFEAQISSHPKIVIFGFGKSCGFCDEIRRFLLEVSNEANFAFELLEIDVEKNPEFVKRFEVQVIPCVRYVRDGESIPALHSLHKQELKEAIENVFSREPLVEFIDSPKRFEELKSEEEFFVVYREGQADGSSSNAVKILEFLSLALDFRLFVTSSDLDQVSIDTLFIHRRFDDGPKMMSQASDLPQDSLAQFLAFFRWPVCRPMNEKNINLAISNQEPFFAIFVDSTHDQAIDSVTRAMLESQNRLLCLMGLPGNLKSEMMIKQSGLAFKKSPKAAIVRFGPSSVQKYHLFDFSKEKVLSFLSDYSSRNLTPNFREEPIPESQPSIVKKLVRGNHDAITLEKTSHVLAAYTTPWCEHCKGVKDALEGSHKLLKPGSLPIVFAEMNAELNEIDGLDLKHYPTVLLFKIGAKLKPVKYLGVLEPEVLLNFLEDQTGNRGKLYERKMPNKSDQEEQDRLRKEAEKQKKYREFSNDL